MKNIKQYIIRLLAGIISLFVLLPILPVQAQEEEKFFINLQEDEEFLVSIEWENSRPILKFVSPSGKVYDPYQGTETTRSSISGTTCYYYIENAEKGKWNAVFDKLDNDSISITLESVSAPFVVKDVTVFDVTERYATVHFEVEYNVDRRINYRVYVSASEDTMGKELYSGSCQTNEIVETTVDLSDVSSYDRYKIYVYAWFSKDGVDIYDGAYSNSFRFTNENQGQVTTPATVEILPEELTARVKWEPKYGYTYIVSIFEDGATEPGYFQEISDTSISSFDFTYGVDTKAIDVRIAERHGRDNYSDEMHFRCDVNKLPEITFEEAMSTNKNFVKFHYKGFPEGHKVEVMSNGETREINLSAKNEGDIEVEISQDYNTVEVVYHYSEDIKVLYQKEIYLQRIPPRIYMLSDYSDVKTASSTIKLVGTVTGADILTIAGEEVEIAADGSFSKEIKLSEGVNTILVEAKDLVGNGAIYTAMITYTPSLTAEADGDEDETVAPPDARQVIKAWFPGLIATFVGLIILVLAAFLPKSEKKPGKWAIVKKIVLYLFTFAIVYDAFCMIKWIQIYKNNHSVSFIKEANQSVNAAAELLASEKLWQNLTVYGWIAMGVLIVLFGILCLVETLKKKQRNSQPKQVEGEKK